MASNVEKGEMFKDYLEKNNAVQVLTEILIKLYNESPFPENPLEFIRQALGEPKLKTFEVEILERKVKVLQAQREILQLENMLLQNEMERSNSEKTPQHETSIANHSPIKHNNDNSATQEHSQITNEIDKLVIDHPSKKDIMKAVRDLSFDLTKVEKTLSRAIAEPKFEQANGDNEQLEYAGCAEVSENGISKDNTIEKDPLLDSGNLMVNSQDLTENSEAENGTSNSINESDLLQQSLEVNVDTHNYITESDLLQQSLEVNVDTNNLINESDLPREISEIDEDTSSLVNESDLPPQSIEVTGKCDNADSISLLRNTTLPSDSDEESLVKVENPKDALQSANDFLDAIEMDKPEMEANVDPDKNQLFNSPSTEPGDELSAFISPAQSISDRSSCEFEDIEENKDEFDSFTTDKSFHSVQDDDQKEIDEAIPENIGSDVSLKVNYSASDALNHSSEIYDPEFSFLLSKSV